MRRESGITLVELIVVLVIAGIMLAVAAPNMSTFVQNNRRAACVNTMVTGLSYARSQAVSRNRRVTLCEVDLGTLAAGAMPTACSGGGAAPSTGLFEDGFMVFDDIGGVHGAYDAASDTILRIFQPTDCDAGNVSLRGFRSDNNNSTGFISYGNTGLPSPPAGTTFGGMYVTYCDARGNAAGDARGIIVSITGQPRNSRDATGSDGIHERPDGNNLVCP